MTGIVLWKQSGKGVSQTGNGQKMMPNVYLTTKKFVATYLLNRCETDLENDIGEMYDVLFSNKSE
jgi:hypothetical protein